MDASLASLQARLATFESATSAKSRRPSARSKKAGTKAKPAWPLSSPSAQDLAYAGFVWRPTTASPDNVQCYFCNCQLDGWEESDVPAFEHLTHSPSCGYAVVACIRLRNGDPGRTEEDPTSEAMVAARRDTFGDLWPLDSNEGYPAVDQMVNAGWYYDPADGTADGVTCAYCSLSLDAWDAGDNPMEEHRRRSPDCLFFTLSQLYNPPPKPEPPKESKRASTKAKRASTRSSTSSTASKKPTRGRKRASDTTQESTFSMILPPPTRGKKRASNATDDSEVLQPTQPEYSDVHQPPTKRFRSSSFSSLPDDLPVGTPKKTPMEVRDTGVTTFEMSSLPASLLVGTPKKTPTMLRDAEGSYDTHSWQPTDMELFFADQSNEGGFMNDILIDAGLDDIASAGANPEDLYAAVLAGLTDQERDMTVEQWVLYNAKRGEEKLRVACEQQILAFEAEGRRAMAMLESIPTL
ncbi:inhibitor of apoptosis repeat-containing protein [Cucurbitaria berberidis CBS 394.84]|uniref:Inhibitor of apoptosis repeat-containing protein n=1 Tax=Cucurbitaria berberidis CBS 394.84 TaxID=1168544 RepID=A0A9P4L8L8_9PLEO|nr:inhibitor of apoptosis repeat-containing protein [Cucurbitaria berberidis CBS 394.84]KAF1845408.1 inhibitor of apoptosis repeat-containing protein [Cucurbitaria berberidis CBS 394.84]